MPYDMSREFCPTCWRRLDGHPTQAVVRSHVTRDFMRLRRLGWKRIQDPNKPTKSLWRRKDGKAFTFAEAVAQMPPRPEITRTGRMPATQGELMNQKEVADEKEIQEQGGAVAPRVDLKKRESVIAKAEFHRLTGTLTVCVLTLVNGFTLVGQSACASPENYQQSLGEKFALEDAERQIWKLEGYLLKQRLYEASLPTPEAESAVKVSGAGGNAAAPVDPTERME